jgi:2-amino-4-hydroxy-6-hydroxymethyldihydropteridine diphosphokinase
MKMVNIHLNIGSNTNRRKNISLALSSLESFFFNIKFSSLYSSPAEGFDGDDFYNIGVNAKTSMSIVETIDSLHSIEQSLGRDRLQKKFSSRIIDLDLVFYGDIVHPKFNIPRDDVLKYAFVLAPASELNPGLLHPIQGLTYSDLWKSFQSNKKFRLIKYNAKEILD